MLKETQHLPAPPPPLSGRGHAQGDPAPARTSPSPLRPWACSRRPSTYPHLPLLSQAVGMLKEAQHLPAVVEMLAKAKQVLGYDLLEVCLNGRERGV